MTHEKYSADARPIFRIFAFTLAVPMVCLGLLQMFPSLLGRNDDPQFGSAFVLLFGGLTFLSLAITGQINKTGKLRTKLHLAAMKYASGDITLDEYGKQTKEILGQLSPH